MSRTRLKIGLTVLRIRKDEYSFISLLGCLDAGWLLDLGDWWTRSFLDFNCGIAAGHSFVFAQSQMGGLNFIGSLWPWTCRFGRICFGRLCEGGILLGVRLRGTVLVSDSTVIHYSLGALRPSIGKHRTDPSICEENKVS